MVEAKETSEDKDKDDGGASVAEIQRKAKEIEAMSDEEAKDTTEQSVDVGSQPAKPGEPGGGGAP